MNVQEIVERPTPIEDDVRFCTAESLILDGIRLWSQNPKNLDYVRRRLIAELGAASGERAAKALKLLGHVVGLHARRTFYLMHPGAAGATADERALLGIIGAQLHRRRAHANALAMWLLPVNCHGTVLAVAGELGRALAAGGHEIAPPRKPQPPRERAGFVHLVA